MEIDGMEICNVCTKLNKRDIYHPLPVNEGCPNRSLLEKMNENDNSNNKKIIDFTQKLRDYLLSCSEEKSKNVMDVIHKIINA